MTTAVSISDIVFETAEQFAARHGLTRNELYETALKQYLQARQASAEESVREQFDAVYSREDSRLDPLFEQIQARSLPADDW